MSEPTADDDTAGEWPHIGEPLAEAALLGCLLRSTSEQARALLAQVTDEDWSVPQHQHVAMAARALLARGEPADAVTVLGQLRRQGHENASTSNRDAGVLLVELYQAAPSQAHARHYLQIVLEHSYRRRAQHAALRILQAADSAPQAALHRLIDREHAALTAHQARITGPRPARAQRAGRSTSSRSTTGSKRPVTPPPTT